MYISNLRSIFSFIYGANVHDYTNDHDHTNIYNTNVHDHTNVLFMNLKVDFYLVHRI